MQQKTLARRQARRWWVIGITCSVLVAGVLWAFGRRSKFHASQPPPSPRLVQTMTIRESMIEPVVPLAGTSEPIRRATPSARIMARILVANFQAGDRVEAKRVLIALDTKDLAARRRQAKAGEEAATTGVEVAEANLRRMRTLVEAGAAPHAQLESAELAVAQVRAARNTARAAIDEVDTNVSYASVSSPFAGVVVQKMAEPGNIVGPGQPLFIVEDDSRLRIVAAISSEDSSGLVPGQKLQVRFGNDVRPGTLEGVLSSGDSRAPGLRVQVLVDNSDRKLRVGSLATVEVPRHGNRVPVLQIPRTAVLERGQLTGVFVVGESGIARLRWVILGQPDGEQLRIVSGLQAGDRLILSPGADLVDGMAVREETR